MRTKTHMRFRLVKPVLAMASPASGTLRLRRWILTTASPPRRGVRDMTANKGTESFAPSAGDQSCSPRTRWGGPIYHESTGSLGFRALSVFRHRFWPFPFNKRPFRRVGASEFYLSVAGFPATGFWFPKTHPDFCPFQLSELILGSIGLRLRPAVTLVLPWWFLSCG
jgi:hypothetical protein